MKNFFIGFLLILAVGTVTIFVVKGKKQEKTQANKNIPFLNITQLNKFMRPVDEKDHLRGSLEAPVKIVEFADLECPFCKKFHPTLKKITSDYQGKVAWVYRHAFPETRKKSLQEAQGAECANEQGGHPAFWQYVDRVFAVTPSEDGLDLSLLPKIAGEMGLDKEKFNQCLASERYKQRVLKDVADAMIAGARGTPYIIIVGAADKRYDLSGNQPYEAVKNLVELALKK